jgi:transaldolase / glucose-6-phosphate isomerase
VLEINPFDQPDVQAAKDKTNEVLAAGEPDLAPRGSVDELLAQASEGDYVCVQAFIDPSREPDLAPLLARAHETGCVVTSGLGPRYLHSTGQLHKGGPNTGLFIQVVDDTGEELAIPGRDFGFGRLIRSQAAGDLAALEEQGRRVVRIRLEDI